jgi:hypothetical protein
MSQTPSPTSTQSAEAALPEPLTVSEIERQAQVMGPTVRMMWADLVAATMRARER